MTGKNRRIHSSQRTLGLSDPCPVCMERHDRLNTIYCSAQCTALANTFRNQFRIGMQKLIVLDFRIEFVDGCYPKIHIPSYMTRFYPHGQTSFFIAPPGQIDVRHINFTMMWEIIYDEIGAHATQFIQETNMKPSDDVHEIRKRFEQWLSLGLTTDETHFICPNCNQLYLDSQLTHWYQESNCAPCSIERIPF